MGKTLALALFVALVLGSLPLAAGEGKGDLSNRPIFKKGAFVVDPIFRVQSWGGWVGDDALLDNGDSMEEPGFRLRRARLGLQGTILPEVSYRIELDVVDAEKGTGSLYQAFVGFAPLSWLYVRSGVQRFPFMKSQLMSSAYLPHLDRPLGAYAMSPENSLGLTVMFADPGNRIGLALGAFNGFRRADSFYQGYTGAGKSLGNRYDGLAYAGRLEVVPLGDMGRGLADPTWHRDFLVALGGGAFFNDGGSINTLAWTTDLHAKLRGAHIFAELTQDSISPENDPSVAGTNPAKISRRSASLSVGYVPVRNLLGLAARAELDDDNLDQENEGDQLVYSGTLTWYAYGETLKFQAEYSHREELHGLALDNDSALAGMQLAF